MTNPTGERPGPPPPAGHQDVWDFDFLTPGGGIAGFCRLAITGERRCWYWAGVVGSDRRYVAVRHHELAVPRGWPLEVRDEGLWSAVVCEQALQHWSVGLEAFGVAFDDPLDAWGDERGDLVPLGFDLEWDLRRAKGDDGYGYGFDCAVSGAVLLGDATIDVDGSGRYRRSYGEMSWRDRTPAGAATPELIAPVLVPEAGTKVLRAVSRDGPWYGWEEWIGAPAVSAAEAAAGTA